ncbi:aminotransferase-like domain-containing protein [Marinibacterium profundimaris]|uniref:Aspartate aminotransferase n=1 Tax=Marinibacterium profundimaris TaxID=1679460 RepID=A0A225NSZ6_9RHOB|nr:PLP-dependent aminotransferase family protein [Marinibacterium profundimaris]OWU77450.1 aspartate aminotransferase [Marinibacterium profundimaris]
MDTIWSAPLKDVKGPKYELVAEKIRGQVASGVLQPGAKLPPVRELAYRLGITPGTVSRAYGLLTDEGILRGEVGRGTFVAEPHPDDPICPDHDMDPDARAWQALEIDVIAHGSGGSDGDDVNLFSPHLPSVGQARLIRDLLGQVAQDPPSGLMHYPSRIGSLPAREAVVRWLGDAPIGAVTPEDIVLTNGGQNAISLILQAMLRGRRPVVLVEELAYPGFRRAAELLRAEVIPVAMDGDGLIPEAVEAAARGCDAQVLCTSPEIHNPTLIYTPLHRRKALAEVARRLDLQIIEDDCYQIRRAETPSYRMIAPERTWYVTSISKSLTPALRVGFAVAPEQGAAPLRRAAEYGFFGLATPLTDLTALLLAHPKIRRLGDEMANVVGRYVHSAVNILGRYDLRWRPEAAFLWLMLPKGWRAGAFCRAAEARGVQLRSAEDFAPRSVNTPHAVRFAVNAGIPLSQFEDALRRLADLLDNPPERIEV